MSQMIETLVLPSPRGGVVVEEIAPYVAQIRINRPERMNALGVETTHALLDFIEASLAAGARTLVLRGSGRSFCAGADLKERQQMDEAARFAHNRAINAAADALAASPVPTIAALNGLALGGGCELAIACDIRIAVSGAQIGLTEARIGAIPGAGGTQRLPRLIGASRALDMILSGEPVTAERAAEIGLVNEVVSAEQFDEHVRAKAALFASRSPTATRLAKQVVLRGLEGSLAQGLDLERDALQQVFGSDDYAEGLAAFAERRPPRFGPAGQKV